VPIGQPYPPEAPAAPGRGLLDSFLDWATAAPGEVAPVPELAPGADGPPDQFQAAHANAKALPTGVRVAATRFLATAVAVVNRGHSPLAVGLGRRPTLAACDVYVPPLSWVAVRCGPTATVFLLGTGLLGGADVYLYAGGLAAGLPPFASGPIATPLPELTCRGVATPTPTTPSTQVYTPAAPALPPPCFSRPSLIRLVSMRTSGTATSIVLFLWPTTVNTSFAFGSEGPFAVVALDLVSRAVKRPEVSITRASTPTLRKPWGFSFLYRPGAT